jgi:hypothetical protein
VRLLVLAAVATVLTSCGDVSRTTGTSVPSAGVSVEQALQMKTDEPLLVKGFLVLDGGHARLCSALAESYPPQCGGPSLIVEGLPPSNRQGLKEAEGVAWSEREVAFLGTVDDGRLRVGATPR